MCNGVKKTHEKNQRSSKTTTEKIDDTYVEVFFIESKVGIDKLLMLKKSDHKAGATPKTRKQQTPRNTCYTAGNVVMLIVVL